MLGISGFVMVVIVVMFEQWFLIERKNLDGAYEYAETG